MSTPAHYPSGIYEPIKVIEAWGLGFCLGNVVKYIARAGKKGDRKADLEKALDYLQRELEREQGRQQPVKSTWDGSEAKHAAGCICLRCDPPSVPKWADHLPACYSRLGLDCNCPRPVLLDAR